MTYQELTDSISAILTNDKIIKKGLMLTYYLTEKNHKQMTEELFYKSNPPEAKCEFTDEVIIEVQNIEIKLVKIIL